MLEARDLDAVREVFVAACKEYKTAGGHLKDLLLSLSESDNQRPILVREQQKRLGQARASYELAAMN